MTTNQELRKLAETVLDDWISTYASEFCAPGRVKQAKERIKDGGGTIAYVTDMRESLSSGIGALLDRIDRLEAENEACDVPEQYRHAIIDKFNALSKPPAPEQASGGWINDENRLAWALWRIKDLESQLAATPTAEPAGEAVLAAHGIGKDQS